MLWAVVSLRVPLAIGGKRQKLSMIANVTNANNGKCCSAGKQRRQSPIFRPHRVDVEHALDYSHTCLVAVPMRSMMA